MTSCQRGARERVRRAATARERSRGGKSCRAKDGGLAWRSPQARQADRKRLKAGHNPPHHSFHHASNSTPDLIGQSSGVVHHPTFGLYLPQGLKGQRALGPPLVFVGQRNIIWLKEEDGREFFWLDSLNPAHGLSS